MNGGKSFVSGVLAGACIALGGVVYLSVSSKALGALIFCVGLFSIYTLGLSLFTGKVCYVFFARERSYVLSLPLIWLGNLAGAALVALAAGATRLGGDLARQAAQLCQIKLDDGWLSLFLLGVLCNLLIYIAVEGFQQSPHQIGKYLAIFFGVTGFILSVYEHCVADMFYFTMAGLWSWDTLLRLLVITLGNAVGGVAFALVRSWLSGDQRERGPPANSPL